MTSDTFASLPLGHASTPGLAIPQLGFGVWEVPDGDVDASFGRALEIGYRHIDTARLYGNEAGVGRVLAATDVPRDDIFVTTKVWNDDHRDVPAAFNASMARLGIETLDLYLIHWPAPKQDAYVDAWKSMLDLQREGRVRSVGVCNFQVPHLQRLLDETGVLPSVNQIELSPYLQQRELRAFHAEHGIVTEAWSPLAVRAGLLGDEVVLDLAAAHGVTPAQVVLRWHIELGNVVLTRSVTPARIEENFGIGGFTLGDGALEALAALDRGTRTGPDPDTFG
ncbi:2,5-diketo-D-gluconate reductase A [Humibacillus xanthopallidus]|uniref:2,5-diketo-D-gluconate reductase A n=1 Tax=Humibacillus xanthopallidus TaxID=412689 RepID=A0A543PX96_9MICO|nr:aldo/keto reductase [Humibacillus xanthopallidus]TQN48708.1 2,5-diketo-D-gluconate reductase A [Humibacillus xanthopallidus]